MHVLSVLPDDRVGGPHVRSLDVAEELVSHDIKTSFLVPADDGDFPATAREAGFKVSTVPFDRPSEVRNVRRNVRFLVGFPGGMRRVGAAIERNCPDLVHLNVSTNFQAATATARSDVPFLWHFNDTLTPTPVREIAAKAASRYADGIAVSATAVADYYFSGKRTNPDVLYPPVKIDRFDPQSAGTEWPGDFLNRETAPDAPIVGTIANINPAKGLEHFLRAIARIKRTHGDVIAPIVGKRLESQRRYYRRLESIVAALDIEDSVHFCGYRDDIPAVLGTFDTFVLPSVTEACPVVVLEAMAMEVPVVATDVGGVREQLIDGQHGFVVPPMSPSAIADSVETILSNPERAQTLGTSARRRVAERFAADIIANRTAEIYEKTLATKSFRHSRAMGDS